MQGKSWILLKSNIVLGYFALSLTRSVCMKRLNYEYK